MKNLCIILSLLILSFSSQAQLLYRVEGNGLKNPSYIFGTHHLAPISILDSIEGYKDAFNSCQIIVGEIDMSSTLEIAKEARPFLLAPEGKRLSQLIPPSTYDSINNSFISLTGRQELNLRAFDALKPIAISAILTKYLLHNESPDFDIETPLDAYFQNLARKDGKKVIGLETPRQQAEILYNTLSVESQALQLIETLKNPNNTVSEIKTLNKAYFNQDLDSLLTLSENDEIDPEFLHALLDKRNEDWISIIPEIMDSRPAFIAVGALHLPGKNGILYKLKEKGYKISPVY